MKNQTNFGTCNLSSTTITPYTINILGLLLYFKFMEKKSNPNKSIHSILARKKTHYLSFKFLNIQVKIQDWNPSTLNFDPITNRTSIATCPILILEFKFQDTNNFQIQTSWHWNFFPSMDINYNQCFFLTNFYNFVREKKTWVQKVQSDLFGKNRPKLPHFEEKIFKSSYF